MGQMMCHKSDQAMSPLMNFDRMGLMSDQLIAAAVDVTRAFAASVSA